MSPQVCGDAGAVTLVAALVPAAWLVTTVALARAIAEPLARRKARRRVARWSLDANDAIRAGTEAAYPTMQGINRVHEDPERHAEWNR